LGTLTKDERRFEMPLVFLDRCKQAVSIFIISFLASSIPSYASSSEGAKQNLTNWSVISVGVEVYTVLDIKILLNLWNALADAPVKLSTDFSRLRESENKRNLTGFKLVQSYPADVRRLLFLLFVWDESRRLNLFSPSAKAFDDAKLAVKFSEFLSDLDSESLTFWNDLGESGQKPYLDIVLRARSFFKVRQDLDSNQRLIELKWFWHVMPEK
jgi:hypothetical protein